MGRQFLPYLRKLQGLFCVYKPPGVLSEGVRNTIVMKLIAELNALPPQSSEQKKLPGSSSEGSSAVELTNVVTSVPSLVHHPFVKVPTYSFLKIGIGHKLDKLSSGVQVFGLNHGSKLLPVMYENHYTRDYTVCGRFGIATSDFSDNGKVIEKTTFDHISRDTFERVLAMIQGANQKSMIMQSQLDLQSQEAYDLAVQGKLRPKVKTPPLILALRCLEFNPPDFTLEIQCMHETPKYLRKVIHEIGLELKSTAVCTKVRRTRDGPFTLDYALTQAHWDLESVKKSLKACQPICEEILKENMDLKNTDTPENTELQSSEDTRTPSS